MYQDQKLSTTPGALITCNWPKAPFRKIRNLLKLFRYHSVQIFFTDLMTNVNLLDLVRLYIDRMIEDCGPCIKGIVMDKETVCDQKQTSRIISLSLFCLPGSSCWHGLFFIGYASKRSVYFRTYR